MYRTYGFSTRTSMKLKCHKPHILENNDPLPQNAFTFWLGHKKHCIVSNTPPHLIWGEDTKTKNA